MAAKDLKPVKMARFRPGMDFTKAKNVLGLSSNLRLEEIRADILQAKFVSQLNKVIQSNFIIHSIFTLLFQSSSSSSKIDTRLVFTWLGFVEIIVSITGWFTRLTSS